MELDIGIGWGYGAHRWFQGGLCAGLFKSTFSLKGLGRRKTDRNTALRQRWEARTAKIHQAREGVCILVLEDAWFLAEVGGWEILVEHEG